MSVVSALESELDEMGVAHTTLAASALALARELDKDSNSATSKSNCAKALNETLDKLRALAPPRDEEDRLDDLSARRAQRLEGQTAT